MAAQFFVPVEGECPARLLGPVQLDVPSIVIQPQILLNGAPFPGNEGGAAILTLWASEPIPSSTDRNSCWPKPTWRATLFE